MPVKSLKIVDCGELKGDDKLTEETAEFLESYAGGEQGAGDEEESDEEDEIAD